MLSQIKTVITKWPHLLTTFKFGCLFAGSELTQQIIIKKIWSDVDKKVKIIHKIGIKMKCQMDLENNSPKTGYRLHSKFKWKAKSAGYEQLGNNWEIKLPSAVVSGNCLSKSK